MSTDRLVINRLCPAGLLCKAVAVAVLGLMAPMSWAERPFLAAGSAVVEDDDEGVFSVETWLSSASGMSGFDTELEYALNPYNSVSLAAGLYRFKEDGVKSYEREYELEYQHNFVDIARDGYGLGVRFSSAWSRYNGDMHWDGWEATVPFSWRSGAGDTLVHVTPGYSMPDEGSDYVTWALGAQHDIAPRDLLFAELAGDRSDDDSTLIHGGWRHWLKRNKVAIDLTAGRIKGEGDSRNFVTLGVALFDLR